LKIVFEVVWLSRLNRLINWLLPVAVAIWAVLWPARVGHLAGIWSHWGALRSGVHCWSGGTAYSTKAYWRAAKCSCHS
jgi:hypothetical protein